MKLKLLSDSNSESGISQTIINFDNGTFTRYFENKEYGSDLSRIVVVFMCRSPDLVFKRRIRFDKSEKVLYMDIMLHLPDVIKLNETSKRLFLLNKLQQELPPIIKKYKFKNFNEVLFMEDLAELVSGLTS